MRNSFVHYGCTVFMALALAGWTAQAGETAPEAAGSSDIDARLKALEKRVQELTQKLEERSAPARQLGQPQRPRGRNMNEMWERFRRDLEQQFGADPQEWIHGPQGPFPGAGQRPRLGVELAAPGDEAANQFSTKLKEGAVVINVVPGSPADKAGIKPGDVITSVSGRKVKGPRDAVSAVRGLPAGKTELIVSRQGELITLAVELGGDPAAEETTAPEEPLSSEGWLRRTPPQPEAGASSRARSKTEVKASALELTDQLAQDLKLTADQRKKMTEILAKESSALADELSAKNRVQRGGGWGYTLDMPREARKLADQHIESAAKELASVLQPEQLKQWNEYRQTHSSLSISQSMEIESSDPAAAPDRPGF